MSELRELIAKVRRDTWASKEYLELAERAARELEQVREALRLEEEWHASGPVRAAFQLQALHGSVSGTVVAFGDLVRESRQAALAILSDGAPEEPTVLVPVERLSTDAIHTLIRTLRGGYPLWAASFLESAQREVDAIDRAALRDAEKGAP